MASLFASQSEGGEGGERGERLARASIDDAKRAKHGSEASERRGDLSPLRQYCQSEEEGEGLPLLIEIFRYKGGKSSSRSERKASSVAGGSQ